MIQRKISDQKALWLIKEILSSSHGRTKRKGIPIGNLTSQLFANIYLNELDQFVKHQLRACCYIRYMDDFLILDFGKKELCQIKEKIREFLQEALSLKLHFRKVKICTVDNGIDFLGYVNFDNHRLLRKNTVKRFIKRTRLYAEKFKNEPERFEAPLISWIAYAKFGNSWRLRRSLSKKLQYDLLNKS